MGVAVGVSSSQVPEYHPSLCSTQLLLQQPLGEVLGKESGPQAPHFFEMEGGPVAWRECGPIFPQLLGGLGPLNNLRVSWKCKSIAPKRKDGVGLNMASTAATWWLKEAKHLLFQFPEGGGGDTHQGWGQRNR